MDTITIKVDPSGKGDFTTINDALDSVEAVNDNIPVRIELAPGEYYDCLLYTSDAADEEDSVTLDGLRIIKKKERAKRVRPGL